MIPFSRIFRRVGVPPEVKRKKGWGYITPVKPAPKLMKSSTKSIKALERKARKAKRRNAKRAMFGKPERKYVASVPSNR